jgi:hypothetical protein
MKFWKLLRWIASLAFLALLLASWFGIDLDNAQGGSANPSARIAPKF